MPVDWLKTIKLSVAATYEVDNDNAGPKEGRNSGNSISRTCFMEFVHFLAILAIIFSLVKKAGFKKPNRAMNITYYLCMRFWKTKFESDRPVHPERFCSARRILTEVHAVSTLLLRHSYRTDYSWFLTINSPRPVHLSPPSNSKSRVMYKKPQRQLLTQRLWFAATHKQIQAYTTHTRHAIHESQRSFDVPSSAEKTLYLP